MRCASIRLTDPTLLDIEAAVRDIAEFCAADDEDVTIDQHDQGGGVLVLTGRYTPDGRD